MSELPQDPPYRGRADFDGQFRELALNAILTSQRIVQSHAQNQIPDDPAEFSMRADRPGNLAPIDMELPSMIRFRRHESETVTNIVTELIT